MSLRAAGQAAATMHQLQQQIDVIGHNIANSQTSGYKAQQSEFANVLYQQIDNLTSSQNSPDRLTPDGIRIGIGSMLGTIHPNMNLGSIQTTDRDLDVALQDPTHFFQVVTGENGADDVRYTRDGSFYLQPVNNGSEAVIVTSDGYPLLGVNGPIRFSTANVSGMHIAADGAVFVHHNNETEHIGTISVAEINRNRLLMADGNNLYQLPEADMAGFIQTVPPVEGIMQNKSLEMSNTDIADQMTKLMNAQRSYQLNARTISMADQMQGLINQLR